MFTSPSRSYHRCFISAPYGIDLGALPDLLSSRNIAWNWATADGLREIGYATGIEKSDFVISVLNGTSNDYRILYEAGIAEGLSKPVFMVATRKRINKVAASRFVLATVSLKEAAALAFQLDLFLSTPHESIFERDRQMLGAPIVVAPKSEFPATPATVHSGLAREVFEAVVAAGGSAIAEPRNDDFKSTPDLLVWLPEQEPLLLDPVVIEIKNSASANDARRVEAQLYAFMKASGVKSGMLLTTNAPPLSYRSLSPSFFWLSIDHFTDLARDGRLGWYVRDLRNRAAHGLS